MSLYALAQEAKKLIEDLTPSNIAQYWSQGIHIKSDGTQINLKDIPTKYLENIIQKFSDQDTTALMTELQSRV